MMDYKFLEWMADRLVAVYGESPNTDFVQKLRRIADRLYDEVGAERDT
jgi:hypothetical protein